ncbi:MAG TPA: DUF4184 family protein [Fibrobacteria bacterium]|nr:DUF4184 family protein [Fibrobacteria bacterium]
MPFTFAHPAAVLPLLRASRKPGWTSALVTGSLAPDLLRPLLSFDREVTHSLLGWFLLNTPMAILAAWLVQRFLVERIRRLPGLDGPSAPVGDFSILAALAGAALGGLTHLGWDAFTHDQAPLTRGGILDTILFMTPAGPFVLGQTLWFANSIVGVLAILIWLLAKIRRSPGGVGALFSWTWFRLLVVPGLPFFWLLLGFAPQSANLPKELFIHLFYLQADTAPYLLVPCMAAFVGLFWWETRPRLSTTPGRSTQ